MSLSVLTIVKNRSDHLSQLIEGLRRSVCPPHELVIVDMNSDPPVAARDAHFEIKIIRRGDAGLPLAAARNQAARAATGDHLLFLDVDCIPMRDLVGDMQRWLAREDALICAEAFYLAPQDARGDWDEERLRLTATSHPVRAFPAVGVTPQANAGLFWSLVFGIRRDRFADIGGFDEAFTGYGAEDTDFGFRARAAGLPLLFMGGPGAFHQYHDVLDPPLQHFRDIIRNARLFYQRWHLWPMEGWLAAFAEMGLITRSDREIEILRTPDRWELERAGV